MRITNPFDANQPWDLGSFLANMHATGTEAPLTTVARSDQQYAKKQMVTLMFWPRHGEGKVVGRCGFEHTCYTLLLWPMKGAHLVAESGFW